MSDLKLKDLRYLVAVADTRHFGRAAAKCFVSQPTLSAQLRKLELYLGVQLIERRPRHVTLTAAGEEITARARTMLESADAIVGLAQTRRDPLAGQLRMALLPTIGPYLLPLVALKMRKALPRLELMLYEYQTEPMLERLHNGDIDLGILALPVHVEGLATRALYEEPFVAALPAGHRLAGAHAHSRRGPQGRDAAAAGGRPLPARPGAGGLQPQRRAGETGFSRHQHRDLAADGRHRRRRDAVAGAGGARRLWCRQGTGDQAVREARAEPPDRRRVAQEQRAQRGDRGGVRSDRAPQRIGRA